jgi:hypothetical protein
MSSNVYSVGLNHVGAYQVSGHPFCKHITDCSQNVVPVFFDKVTQWIQIVNHEQSELYVAFHENQLSWDSVNSAIDAGPNHFKIHAVHSGGSKEGAFPQILPLKTDRIYLIMDAGANPLTDGVDVVAGLTNIPASRMYELDGTGINE